ncbi:SRPBCC domain-containing protein [Polaribacter pectinis]|uniref:SRPBCC domain-containing protein n=1 Tax=Polaribacter pectinis TaxID=2738844 RepID=A0A7G9L908_9FLAO|nr:SRPBCC domain-containing protein [Polaribacter pectinis]QNM85107.1 SRPBCC domain-containing protein [Polaribacter pectinis]
MESKKVEIEAKVDKPIQKVWEFWTEPKHITNWNFASVDWHCPYAENDLKKGGKFSFTMASRDGKMSFDLGGTYDEVTENNQISSFLEDGRKVDTYFTAENNSTIVKTIFETENTNPIEMQKSGWQAILNNFKKYAENR